MIDPTATAIIGMLVGLVGAGTGIAAYVRNGKHDTAKIEKRIAVLESKNDSMQDIINAVSVADMARLQQTVSDLNEKVKKLDSDTVNKIDKLSEKIDGFGEKLNELFIKLINAIRND